MLRAPGAISSHVIKRLATADRIVFLAKLGQFTDIKDIKKEMFKRLEKKEMFKRLEVHFENWLNR
jgi:hypothetical protein